MDLAITITLAAGNLVLGLAYTGYGAMTLTEMIRDRATRGFSHFGAAWVVMAFTCGPHHWVHGLHLAFEGRTGGGLDLFAVMFGMPAGLIWFLLRFEAFTGGRGDRHIPGNPAWVLALPTVLAMYVTALGAAALGVGGLSLDASNLPLVVPNVMLVVLYGFVGYFVARTQVLNRKPLGGWSLSGVALAVVFPTCALMHGVYALYGASGLYSPDVHGLGVDVIAVPAAAYFLWVVHGLYRGTFRDWNGVPVAVKGKREALGPVAAPG